MNELMTNFPYLLAPLIFFARVVDVSLGTFRTILIFRGRKFLAAIFGFFEIIIWLIAAGKVLTNLDQWYLALAYAGGFAVGNFVGMWIEGFFAIGDELVLCISFNRDILAEKLRTGGFKVVSFDGKMGENNPIELLLIIEKRRKVPSLVSLIRKLDKDAVYSVSNVKSVYEGPDLLPRRSFLDSAFKITGKRK